MKKIILLLFIFTISLSAIEEGEKGIYTLVVKNINKEISKVNDSVLKLLNNSNYQIQSHRIMTPPDHVREDSSEHCGYKGFLYVLTSNKYTHTLTKYGNKYIAASFLRIGVYENENGIQIVIADPETINRITFNDLYENEEFKKYDQIIEETKKYKSEIISLLHKVSFGEKVETYMPPLRDAEDIAESSKDMFMMVGPLTFFTDSDQFPILKEYDNKVGVFEVVDQLKKNIKNFEPEQDDIEYRWTTSKKDLQWEIIAQEISPDSNAILLGITRPRTEGVSFHIAGSSREDENLCPGIDHICAYPIEVLIINEGDKIKVYSPREMFRMDMYFWDAGMNAFMNHMSMPAILDESIYKALFGVIKD